MDCAEIKERLSAYVDDVLDAESKAVVEEHLSTCRDCQQEMVSLKALVRELGSLESVEPPRDFLDQLHERIEARSWFSKILRTLFVPMRVKIPLEFAGAVAVAILVFAVLHTQKDQLRLGQAPEGLRQERASEQVATRQRQAEAPFRVMEKKAYRERTVDSSGDLAKDEAYKPQLARKAEEERMAKEDAVERLSKVLRDLDQEQGGARIQEAPPPEREAIELALVMKKEIRPESLAPGSAMEADPAPKRKMRRSLALPQAAPSAKPERDEEVDDALSELTKRIELVGGEVVSVDYDEWTKALASIRAQIPASQIHTFYNKLKELGDLQTPPEAVTGKEHEVLPVSIRLLPSK
ncbi:MAG: zf-HC2 domain-containing protein [Desulfobacteraceae bacterium]|jgi:hypothetical protein